MLYVIIIIILVMIIIIMMIIIIIMIMIIITKWTKIISQLEIVVDKMHMAGCVVVRCLTPKTYRPSGMVCIDY